MAEKSYADMLAGGWRALAFAPFREGVDIYWLKKNDAADAASVALLKYAPGASVPRHRHAGLETVVVLEGAQSDEEGEHRAGAVVVNAEGSEHSVWSPEGCVVLIFWARPVVILGAQG